jgi:Asp-tRNA(Asn)/Glu-tRNA(Gln) amidotransferase A subunit family amidase
MVPLALGSQSVGSVIRPASYCGVWAFVPSRGAVPREGTFVLSDTLDRVGVFADSADLLSLAAGALLDADPTGVPAERPGAPRIAVLTGRSLAAHAPEPLRLLAELAAGERLPLHAVEADIDLSAVLAATRTIGVHELHRALGRDQPGFAPLDPAVIGPLVPPDPGKDAYESALEHARLLAGTWDGLMAGFDACLLPSAVAAAPRGPLDDQDASPAALGSLLGLPTVGMPLFTTAEGLPLGCQLLARRGGDSAALRLSAEVFHALKAGAGLRGE